MCVLLGYGADAVCPYLVFETMNTLRAEGVISNTHSDKDIFKVSCLCLSITRRDTVRTRKVS